LKKSIICFLGSLLISVTVCATGIIPVIDLDFTRSATETLKKLGINDACIIAASNPTAFTYCREGSSTLWQYQAFDLEQLRAIQGVKKLPSADDKRISVVEVNSVACQQDNFEPLVKPATTHWPAIGLIALLLLIGVRYTYRAIKHRHYHRTGFSDTRFQRLTESVPLHTSTTKALLAFVIAAVVAFVYFGYLGL
jgi:hypothetical protein